MQQDDGSVLATLFLIFVPLSLTAFGGGISVISEMQHQAVDVQRWVSGSEFLALFAISRGAPGPGAMMLATLIGWKAAGLAGAIVATVGMFAPASILCLAMAAVWSRFRGRVLMVRLEKALIPIGAGLLVAGIVSLLGLASTSWALLAIAVASALACLARPITHPLIVIGVGAIANLLVVTLT